MALAFPASLASASGFSLSSGCPMIVFMPSNPWLQVEDKIYINKYEWAI